MKTRTQTLHIRKNYHHYTTTIGGNYGEGSKVCSVRREKKRFFADCISSAISVAISGLREIQNIYMCYGSRLCVRCLVLTS
jgi:hypothetical protein